MCVYNKEACMYIYIYVCVCVSARSYLDKYINATTWPLQTKISDFTPVTYHHVRGINILYHY